MIVRVRLSDPSQLGALMTRRLPAYVEAEVRVRYIPCSDADRARCSGRWADGNRDLLKSIRKAALAGPSTSPPRLSSRAAGRLSDAARNATAAGPPASSARGVLSFVPASWTRISRPEFSPPTRPTSPRSARNAPAVYEYQTLICQLTGWTSRTPRSTRGDGGGRAVLMCARMRPDRRKVLVARSSTRSTEA